MLLIGALQNKCKRQLEFRAPEQTKDIHHLTIFVFFENLFYFAIIFTNSLAVITGNKTDDSFLDNTASFVTK